ncbi:MAG TPA: CatB-related O-acetyltransferase [Bacteroidales bacterium]|nr:CatB-related O-acetyltransferase [Bacteroidales bacterium]
MLQFLWKLFLKIKYPSCTIRAAALGANIKLGKGVTIEYGSHVKTNYIGKYTYINKYCMIDGNTISIGNFCSIAYGAKIGLGKHPTKWVSSHPFSYDPKYKFVEKNISFEEDVTEKCIIGNDVWIGANAIIMAGVKVGDGAIIGANSVVTKDVEPYAIVIGAPARLYKYRFDEDIRKKLLEIKWWNWPDHKIKDNIHLINNPAEFINKHYKM